MTRMTYKKGLIWGVLAGLFLAMTASGMNVYATQEGKRNAAILVGLADLLAVYITIKTAYQRKSVFSPGLDGFITGLSVGATIILWLTTGTIFHFLFLGLTKDLFFSTTSLSLIHLSIAFPASSVVTLSEPFS